MDEIRLNCALLGPDVTPIFTVSISRQKAIDELKVAIKDRLKHDLAHTDAHRLDLWKVCPLLAQGDIVHALEDRTQLTNDNAELLDPTDFVSEHFGESPAHRGLHIVVQAPHPGEPRIRGPVLPPHAAAPPAPRSASKNTKPLPVLSGKLKRYRTSHATVRGPPASGKSTLLHLLWARIRAADPHADVHALAAWPAPLPRTDERDIIARLTRRIPGYPNPENTTYLLAGHVLGHVPLGGVLQERGWLRQVPRRGVLQLRRRGRAPARVRHGRADGAQPAHADEFGAIGLLFTRGEFGEVVERETGLALERDLQERVFAWTGGHAGAVADVLRTLRIVVRTPRQMSARAGPGVPHERLGVLCRPRPGGRAHCVCAAVAAAPRVSGVGAAAVVDPTRVSRARRLGCCGRSGFRPARLAGTHHGVNDAGADRPPAGGYRDEFYRALFDATDGCVRVSSSATDGARVDFFVPARKWGIELLRDGRKVQDRFHGDGAYGAWLAPADVAERIVLDFRGSRPREACEDVFNFYYVVFTNAAFDDVVVLDSRLGKVAEFVLMDGVVQ
ncbi:hypothetical protein HWV62_29715 [Athelia sp. TMB]|nr:hypothetical protein HWV62_29715 [Athelia sp. TMB]